MDLTIPLMCDANTGWKMHQAMRVVNAVKDLDVYIEQPCLTYDECLSVRRLCPLPMIFDECMDDIGQASTHHKHYYQIQNVCIESWCSLNRWVL